MTLKMAMSLVPVVILLICASPFIKVRASEQEHSRARYVAIRNFDQTATMRDMEVKEGKEEKSSGSGLKQFADAICLEKNNDCTPGYSYRRPKQPEEKQRATEETRSRPQPKIVKIRQAYAGCSRTNDLSDFAKLYNSNNQFEMNEFIRKSYGYCSIHVPGERWFLCGYSHDGRAAGLSRDCQKYGTVLWFPRDMLAEDSEKETDDHY